MRRMAFLPLSHAWFVLLMLAHVPLATAADKWVLVDTGKRTVTVFEGNREIKAFDEIAIGRGGTSTSRTRGDNTTPLGEFRIHWINRDSKYHIFLGLDFPDFEHIRHAYADGRLSIDDFLAVTDSLRREQVPPQTTGVGGHIGIHGLGKADEAIHQRMDWTRGCVAMTDQQVEELAELIDIGTRVVVR